MRLPVPELDHVCTLNVELDPIREMGPGRAGQRRIIPIVGGSVEGTRLSGRLLCLGADWQTVFADGLAELDTRYAMETHDGAVIEVVNYGFRHGPPEVIDAIARGADVDPGATTCERTLVSRRATSATPGSTGRCLSALAPATNPTSRSISTKSGSPDPEKPRMNPGHCRNRGQSIRFSPPSSRTSGRDQ